MLPEALEAQDLCPQFTLEERGIRTSDDISPSAAAIGQDRGFEALRFGVDIRAPGYNLFLLGREGTGMQEAAVGFLKERALQEITPADWVYVSNFAQWHRPNAMRLPPGQGRRLADAMDKFIAEVRESVPAFLEAEENQNRIRAIEEDYQQRPEKALEDLRTRAAEKSIALIRTPMGFGFGPLSGDQIVKPEVFKKLPKTEREKIEAEIEGFQKELQAILKQIQNWDRERREAIRKLISELTALAIGTAMEQLLADFRMLPEVLDHLEDVRRDLVENFHGILAMQQKARQAAIAEGAGDSHGDLDGFERYRVNPLVVHEDGQGAPVVIEDHPTLFNLAGRVEHLARYGALVTDFNLIKAGALHRANGGYLVLDARKVLTEPFAWDALKRALKAANITIESPGQSLSLVATVSLEPEPIPLDIKVVLVGERMVYYLLSELDPEFPELFKIEADFDETMDRDAPAEDEFLGGLAERIRRVGLRPFDSGALAQVLRHSVRLAGDRKKLSIEWRGITDLLREANHLAAKSGRSLVLAEDVRGSIDLRIRRADRLREKSLEAMHREQVLIDSTGTRVGQINALSVLQLGGFAFGRPSRITARVRLGAGKVIDIEREVELGGPLHSKGILILSGFLSARYAPKDPFSLAATLVFEQSYGGVDGDSASAAELYCLLSALSELPLRQDLAVTGSVNQFGDVQAIGGVNEKIEGFFDLCKLRGLTGSQGVLIPVANRDHLVLKDDVVSAVADGKFHVYAVRRIDQGIALLTGKDAGERDRQGRFPKDSVNGLVEERLRSFARARRDFGRTGPGGQGADGQGPDGQVPEGSGQSAAVAMGPAKARRAKS